MLRDANRLGGFYHRGAIARKKKTAQHARAASAKPLSASNRYTHGGVEGSSGMNFIKKSTSIWMPPGIVPVNAST